jgi:hypothetical protein
MRKDFVCKKQPMKKLKDRKQDGLLKKKQSKKQKGCKMKKRKDKELRVKWMKSSYVKRKK